MIGLGWLQRAKPSWYERIYRPLRQIDRRWYQQRFDQSEAIDMMATDWDTLVLLDGCRVDTYRSVVGETLGPVDHVTSPGTESWGFMQKTYVGRSFPDCVFVTANPHTHKLPKGTFHAIIDAKETHWDEESGTVRPEELTQVAQNAHVQFPDKRIIVHYMQPHFPFLGPSGSFDESSIDNDERGFHPWQEQSWGTPIGQERLVQAYQENLGLTIPHVQRLLDEIGGRVVISSDHANLLGDIALPAPLRVWGHPEDFSHPKLTEVPWVVAQDGSRRDVVEGELGVERPDYDDEHEIKDQLKSLGYR